LLLVRAGELSEFFRDQVVDVLTLQLFQEGGDGIKRFLGRILGSLCGMLMPIFFPGSVVVSWEEEWQSMATLLFPGKKRTQGAVCGPENVLGRRFRRMYWELWRVSELWTTPDWDDRRIILKSGFIGNQVFGRRIRSHLRNTDTFCTAHVFNL
jgi:hypothetical protein